MSSKEDWLRLRQTVRILSREAQIESFCEWAEKFIAEHSGAEDAFARLANCSKEQVTAWLKGILEGRFVRFGTGPQLECILLASLFHVLTFGRCIVATLLEVDPVVVRKISRLYDDLDKLAFRYVGGHAGVSSSLRYADCTDSPLVLGDYHMLVTAIRVNPASFPPGLPILFLEADQCLYCNRLVFYDNGRPHSSGMIYHQNDEKMPMWRGNPNVYDAPGDLFHLHLELAGGYSEIDEFSREEMQHQLPEIFENRTDAGIKLQYTAFTFRSNAERVAALALDIQKVDGDAIVFFNDESVGKALAEELRKGGQDVQLALETEDIVTSLTSGKGKRVILEKQLTTTLVPDVPERRKGALFIADIFAVDTFYAKMFSVAEHLMEQTQQPRMYFSQEDRLIQIYEEQGGFERFYKIMEFTERYDPWRQIRRVLARLLLRRLSQLRKAVLDDDMPIPIASLQGRQPKEIVTTKGGAKAAKMIEGLCFCGSGKPFKECHGKPKAAKKA